MGFGGLAGAPLPHRLIFLRLRNHFGQSGLFTKPLPRRGKKFLLINPQFMSTKTQDYKTHRRIVPGYHGLTFLLIMGIVVGGIILAFCNCPENAFSGSLIALTGIALGLTAFYARQFAIKAQDRAIRAEENFRHFVLTGKALDSRLRIGQIVGLRFASDEEFPALAAKAAAENLKGDDIKKLIKTWRGDFHRV